MLVTLASFHALTFLKLLNPPKILPPIHVVHFLSGGARIRIFTPSFSPAATFFFNSYSSLSPNLLVNVVPPLRTMLE
jgi:hypothetical protein